MKRDLLLLVSAILTLYACGTIDLDNPENDNSTSGDVTGLSVLPENEAEDSFDLNDYTNTVTVAFNGTGAVITKSSDLESLPVSKSGAYVTIGDASTQQKNMQIILSGSTSAGSLKVYNAKKFVLVLNGVSITSGKGAAINNQCPKTMYVQLNEGTANSLCDASSYSDAVSGEDCNAALFSEGQMVISGSGSLSVTARYKHAISSDDYIRVDEGNITVPSAAGDGIHVNDYYYQTGGSVIIKAVDDGVQVEKGFVSITGGSLTVSTSGTKGKGVNALGDIEISGGTISVSSTGTKGEGIESEANIYFKGGRTYVYSAKDDAINSGGIFSMEDGFLYAYAPSNDAIDSNSKEVGAITITGGVVVAHGSNSPEEAFDCDSHSRIKITGGTVFGTGGVQSGGSFSSSQYGAVISGSVSTGYFTVTDDSGNVIMSCKVPRSLSSCAILVSSPSFKSSGSYKYSVLSSKPNGATTVFEDYYYGDGSATASTSFDVGTTYTFSGGGGGGGFPGGGGGGGRPGWR